MKNRVHLVLCTIIQTIRYRKMFHTQVLKLKYMSISLIDNCVVFYKEGMK